jgi:hypothetical protein
MDKAYNENVSYVIIERYVNQGGGLNNLNVVNICNKRLEILKTTTSTVGMFMARRYANRWLKKQTDNVHGN